MITFKSPEDLRKLPSNDPANPVIQDLIDSLISAYTWENHSYLPEDYGYIILVQPQDAHADLNEIWEGCRLTDIPWEGITLR